MGPALSWGACLVLRNDSPEAAASHPGTPWALPWSSLGHTEVTVDGLDAFDGFQPPGPDCFDEVLVVLFVLVGVTRGEVGDRLVELIGCAQAFGDGDGVTGPGVSPGQRPPAEVRVEREPG